ncbi:unnamed protein product [Didymodactylos carnosus]|uniref:Uncharacterized protein n=1 Tax=Didymodactylos carnosus TaxID=1234261 RepID=A0A814TY04_9BILA|nr:unnamed protein product [Didymodactylos carnosus]CAF1420904.1 unnamed protein product [Didymodactylos carnosus]CAF3930509.1 unnamed protein product [Didymodactylos carnosus]CAF4221686.1 unnamed protein product [Didymodactylos carnosus]
MFKAEETEEDQYDKYASVLGIPTARLLLCARGTMTKTAREIVKLVLTPEQVAAYKNKDDVPAEIRAAIHGFVRKYHLTQVCTDRTLNEAIRSAINNEKGKITKHEEESLLKHPQSAEDDENTVEE